MPLNYVTITGSFLDGSDTPVNGTVTFTPSETVYSSGVPVASVSNPVTATITNGTLQAGFKLLATDNTLSYEGLTGFFYWTAVVNIAGVAQTPWSFFLPHTPSTVDLYTLANTAAGGGGGSGFANPMTTLGDIIYEDATPTAVRLAGSTSSTKKYLTQTGTGSVSAAPAWGSIAAGDVPTLNQDTTGKSARTDALDSATTTVNVSAATAPSSGQVLTATDSTHATWQTAAAADQPYQFRPETYGALGNGRVVGDVVINGTTTITSATAAFVSGDVGKTIMINGGQGATAAPLVTTIASVTNGTTAVLNAAASASGTACAAVIGTDDTSAINQAVQAAGTYALANGYFGEVLFGSKIYMVATDRVQSGNGSTTPTFNTQIALPYPAANGTGRKLVIALTGAGDAGFYQYWESTTPNLAGTALVSTSLSAPSTPDATFGNQSVIGGPSGSAGFTGGFANVKVVVKGIEVVSPAYTNQYAFDFGYVSAMRITQSSAHILAPTGINGGTSPLLKDLPAQVAFQGKIGSGLRSPVVGNNADVTADDFTVEGYSRGLYVFDHFTAGKISCLYNDVALKIDLTQGLSGTSHGIYIALLGAEVYNGGISSTGSGSNYCHVYINLDAECTAPAYDISDSGNVLHGEVHFADPADARPVVVSNASNLKVIDEMRNRGPMASPPSAPASGSASAAIYRDATWYVSAATSISAVSVGGTATGLTGGAGVVVAIPVPSGYTFTPTYTGAMTVHAVVLT